MAQSSQSPFLNLTLLEQVSLNINPQEASPLFALIPPEIRYEIFVESLAPYDVLDKPTSFHSYGYRPEHAFAHRCTVELLRTCKQIYLETRLIVPETLTFVQYHCASDRAPRSRAGGPRFLEMTVEQQEKVRTIHLYIQQASLDNSGWMLRLAGPVTIQPRRLVVTVRHHDWFLWEYDSPLNMDAEPRGRYGRGWNREFRRFPMLEEFAMELETLARRMSEMDRLVRKIQRWKIPLGNGRALCSSKLPLKKRIWAGTVLGKGRISPPRGSMFIPYYVVRIEWRVKEGVKGVDDDDDNVGPSDSFSTYLGSDDEDDDNGWDTDDSQNSIGEENKNEEEDEDESSRLGLILDII